MPRIDSDGYVEWGVTDRWMAGGKAVFGTAFITDATGSRTISGFGESDVFVQRQLQRAEHSATALPLAAVWSGAATGGARPAMNRAALTSIRARCMAATFCSNRSRSSSRPRPATGIASRAPPIRRAARCWSA